MGAISGLFKNVANSAKGMFHKKPVTPKFDASTYYGGGSKSTWVDAPDSSPAPTLRLFKPEPRRSSTPEDHYRAFAEHQQKVQQQVREASDRMNRFNERVHNHPPSLQHATHSGVYTTGRRKMIAGIIDQPKNFGKVMSPIHPTVVKDVKGLVADNKKGSEKLFNTAVDVAKAVPFKAEGNTQKRLDIASGIRNFRKMNKGNKAAKSLFSVGYRHGAVDKVKENAKYTGR